jgi:hypothetical protein
MTKTSRKDFLSLFKVRTEKYIQMRIGVADLLLSSVIDDDVSSENAENVMGKFAIRLIKSGFDQTDAYNSLLAFEDIINKV